MGTYCKFDNELSFEGVSESPLVLQPPVYIANEFEATGFNLMPTRDLSSVGLQSSLTGKSVPYSVDRSVVFYEGCLSAAKQVPIHDLGSNKKTARVEYVEGYLIVSHFICSGSDERYITDARRRILQGAINGACCFVGLKLNLTTTCGACTFAEQDIQHELAQVLKTGTQRFYEFKKIVSRLAAPLTSEGVNSSEG